MPRHRADDDFDDATPPRPKRLTGAIIAAVCAVSILPMLCGAAAILWLKTFRPRSPAAAARPARVDLAGFLDEWGQNPVDLFHRHRDGIVFTGRVAGVRSRTPSSVYLEIRPADSKAFAPEATVTFTGEFLPALKAYPVGSLITVDMVISEPGGTLRGTARQILPGD